MHDQYKINSKHIVCLLVPWQRNENENTISSVNVSSCNPLHVPSFESKLLIYGLVVTHTHVLTSPQTCYKEIKCIYMYFWQEQLKEEFHSKILVIHIAFHL